MQREVQKVLPASERNPITTSGASTAKKTAVGITPGGSVITSASKVKNSIPSTETAQQEIEDVRKEGTFPKMENPAIRNIDIKEGSLYKSFKKVIQDGAESLKELEVRTPITQFNSDGSYRMPVSGVEKELSIEYEAEKINKFKRQYRSGAEVQADYDNITGREKQELKEVQFPMLIKPQLYRGNIAYADANLMNGAQKMKQIERASGLTFPSF